MTSMSVAYVQAVQKALKEEDRQRTDLTQMQKDLIKTLEEKRESIADQQ